MLLSVLISCVLIKKMCSELLEKIIIFVKHPISPTIDVCVGQVKLEMFLWSLVRQPTSPTIDAYV